MLALNDILKCVRSVIETLFNIKYNFLQSLNELKIKLRKNSVAFKIIFFLGFSFLYTENVECNYVHKNKWLSYLKRIPAL